MQPFQIVAVLDEIVAQFGQQFGMREERDVAALLGCSYTEARERLLDGRIRAMKDGRWLRTRREWVEEYIARQTVQTAQAGPDVHSVPVPRKKRPCQFTFEKEDAGYRFLKKLSEG